MKSEKGITLISVTVYIIAMLIIITAVTVATAYYYNNIQTSKEKYDALGEYTKFNSYFSEEINFQGNKVVKIESTEKNQHNNNYRTNYIVFSSNNQYTFIEENKSIYKNNIKIASYIEDCTFKEKIEKGKVAIEVSLTFRDGIKKQMIYVLKNW